MKIIKIPNYIRLKSYLKLNNIKINKLINNKIIIKNKLYSKYYLNYSNNYYEFNSLSDVIIPFKLSEKLKLLNKNNKIEYLNYNNIQLDINNKLKDENKLKEMNKIPVIALLGHYNHGKTTLLDLFAKSKIVSEEVHGITQVNNNYILFLMLILFTILLLNRKFVQNM